ncbi:MAG: TetR family transcriptional regulator, partial [Novosphingobium sp.]
MATGNRVNSTAEGRGRILDATEHLMLEDGYAGVSSRKVAARVGLKSNLLHYHYRTMDDLFIAVFRRREDWYFVQLAAAAASTRPLRALWAHAIDAAGSKLNLEFNALACHRPVLRGVIAHSIIRDRGSIAAALQSVFERYGVGAPFSPKLAALFMSGLARSIAIERALGVEHGNRMCNDIAPEWKKADGHGVMRIEVEDDPNITLECMIGDSGKPEEHGYDGYLMTVTRIVNAIPYVCAAPPGLVRRQNIRHNSRRRLAECGPRLGVDVRRRACGAASADIRWS